MKLIFVNECMNCPWRQYISEGPKWILKCKSAIGSPQNPIIGIVERFPLLFKLPIPEWCPLDEVTRIKENLKIKQ